MLDVIFIVVTVVFFIIVGSMSAAATVYKEVIMALEYVIGIIVSFLIMGYLIYALLWPEKF